MTKQPITNPVEGETSGEPVLSGFEHLIKELKAQSAEFKTEETVLIGNCPQNVTEEEINTFFCGFATITKLRQFTQKCLTTKVFIAKFDSAESASRSKVLNTLSLNGKKILLLQPDEKQFVDKKRVVELNGLQEHTEEVIYDHMTTFGNVSFILKSSTVTYVVFEEPSAVEASCRCDYLNQYPVTIRSVLDGASIETCILEQIDQNSSLLVDGEEEGQINNFMQLLDMENLDDYLEVDEKDRSGGSEKPLLEVGNEEIIVTEDETGVDDYVDAGEADVAAIEERALQSQSLESFGTVLVDDRTRRLLKLDDNLLWLNNLPQLRVKVRKVINKKPKNKTKGPKKFSGSDEVVKKKKNKKEKHEDRKVVAATTEEKIKAADPVKMEAKKEKIQNESDINKKKEDANKDVQLDKAKEISPEKHMKKQKKEKQASVGPKIENVSETSKACVPDAVSKKKEVTTDRVKEDSKGMDKTHKKKKVKKEVKIQNADTTVPQHDTTPSEVVIAKQDEAVREKKIEESSESMDKHQKKKKKKPQMEVGKAEVQVDKTEAVGKVEGQIENAEAPVTKSDTKPSEMSSPKQVHDMSDQTKKQQEANKKVFVQLIKLSAAQINSLSTIRRPAITSQVEDAPDQTEKQSKKFKKPGPNKAAMKKHLESMKASEETAKQCIKRSLEQSPSNPETSEQENTVREKRSESSSPQRKKKPKLEKAVENDSRNSLPTPVTKEEKTLEESEVKPKENKETISSGPEPITDESMVLPELQDAISESVPDICNTVEIDQVDSVVDMESEDERPLVIDEPHEEIVATQCISSKDETKSERLCVALDAKSARLLKGKTHGEDLLFLDILPRTVVRLKRVVPSDFNVVRPKEHSKKSSEHHPKSQHQHKDASEHPSVKKKEDKPEKPRKTNLDKIDSKFLPANSKLKSKIKSKTDINHKKHLPVPDLPIELKTHLNTSFKIPKKNSNQASASIDRNASELNCLHKEPTDRNDQRKRFQKERKPREFNKNRGEWIQKRPADSSGPPPKERDPSPVDYFDPSFDDHSPSPQRIPPTPPPQSDKTTPANAPPKPTPQNENRRFDAQNRNNNKPSFQDIWNIPQKKPEVWAQPPWDANKATSNTISSGDTWDSGPLREHNSGNRQFQPVDNRATSDGPRSRDQQKQGNTLGAGESWSPGGPSARKQVQTIDHGESWSPGLSNRDNKARDSLGDRPAGRSRSPPRQVQQNISISTGDMWDDADSRPVSRKQSSPERSICQNRNRNPLLCDLAEDEDNEPTGLASPPFERSPSLNNEPDDRSPIGQQRSRSRSPGRPRSRSSIRHNRPGPALTPDRRNFRPSFERSPVRRKRSRSRSPDQQRRRSQEIWNNPGANRSPGRRDNVRNRSPGGGRWRRSRSRSPPNRQRGPPFRGSSPGWAPCRSRSPSRADRTLSPSEIWDSGRRSPRNQRLSPKRDDRRTLDHRFPQGQISPNREIRRGTSRDCDRSRRDSSFDRPLLHEDNNRRRSRDRSPDRRQRSRSPPPGRWQHRRSMENSPVSRRLDIRQGSPSYKNTLDYWKAVEDQEMGNMSPNSRISEKCESPIKSPEQWSPRDILEPGDKSWSPPPPKVSNVERRNTSRIDCEQLWANDPRPKYQGQPVGTYSPSSALDAISSEDECDFSNTRRGKKKRFETIPLNLLTRNHSPQSKENELSVDKVSRSYGDPDVSRDSFDSIPSYKDLGLSNFEKEESTTDKEQLGKTDPVPENHSPNPGAMTDERKNVLDNLKQRAERLKKLEEMKLARQKLLAQIKHKSAPEIESKHEESGLHHTSVQSKEDKSKKTKPEPPKSILDIVSPEVLLATVNSLLSSVDNVFNKPSVSEPETKSTLPELPLMPVCPPLPSVIAPLVPPLPADAPPPPPPDEPPPPEPNVLVPHAWEPTTSFIPMLPIDVSQPPPQLINPLLQQLEPSQHVEEETPFKMFSEVQSTETSRAPNTQMPPPSFLDRFRSESNQRHNLNRPHANNMSPNLDATDENMHMQEGNFDFREREIQQNDNRDPRQQNWQQHQQRFGGNHAQQDQNQQQRDPRQNNAGNLYGRNRGGRGGRFNRNPGNNFNNQGNRFNNNNNPGNNFNNNRRNNFNDSFGNDSANNFNNNQGNRFNNSNPGNNFNFNNNRRNNFNDNFGNDDDNSFNDNFNNCDSGNNFDDNGDDGNNFDNNSGNNFDGNFNDDSGNNFNNNFGNNNFNNQGNRFHNSNPQQRFNFHQRNQRFNNNRFNNQQQQNFRQQMMQQQQQQQQMFDEGCFDMNEMDDGNNNDGGANWDDME
ncbi:serine/arginine repetitive matrix protein 2-like isoform X2 [Armigeres subalbatus]|uniref:serine/arginine repetitive matrix protein 2-like isoform X2 n=1 Tax=Armigeres subalbatus TaxID=124917 RepID=UPI002ED11FA2